MSPKRPATASDDRDNYVEKHDTPVRGISKLTPEQLAAPHEVTDPVTGVLQGPALKKARSQRSTEERFEHIEDKGDKTDERVGKLETAFARFEGKLDTALAVIVPVQKEQHATARAGIDGRTKVLLALIGLAGTALGLGASLLSGCA